MRIKSVRAMQRLPVGTMIVARETYDGKTVSTQQYVIEKVTSGRLYLDVVSGGKATLPYPRKKTWGPCPNGFWIYDRETDKTTLFRVCL
jgi:hypothetical protein